MTRIYDRKMTVAEACDEFHEVSKRNGIIGFADYLTDDDREALAENGARIAELWEMLKGMDWWYVEERVSGENNARRPWYTDRDGWHSTGICPFPTEGEAVAIAERMNADDIGRLGCVQCVRTVKKHCAEI